MQNMILTIADRDGTLIEFISWLGRESNWKEQTKLKLPVINLLKYIQKNHSNRLFVVTNQSGVARKGFDCLRVEEINQYLNETLTRLGVVINGWNYCPNVDLDFVKLHPEINFDQNFIKVKTNRKPSTGMVLELLKKNNLDLSFFERALVIGDSEDDKSLAENLKGFYIDVKEKTYEQLKKEFEIFVSSRI